MRPHTQRHSPVPPVVLLLLYHTQALLLRSMQRDWRPVYTRRPAAPLDIEVAAVAIVLHVIGIGVFVVHFVVLPVVFAVLVELATVRQPLRTSG